MKNNVLSFPQPLVMHHASPHERMASLTPTTEQQSDRAAPSSSPNIGGVRLPRYLFIRDGWYYFKRKIPSDVRSKLADKKSQVWKSLGTRSLVQAKIRLAVELVEFDYEVARLRRQSKGGEGVHGLRTPVAMAIREAALQTTHQETTQLLLATLEAQVQSLKSIFDAQNESQRLDVEGSATVGSSNSSSRLATVPCGHDTGLEHLHTELASNAARRPTLLLLFEDWKLKQTRSRSINSVHLAVTEFRTLNGPLSVYEITRQHARDYRESLRDRGFSRGTIENRVGFLSTLVRHGMREIVEDLTRNPFEGIEITGGQGKRTPKDRRAFEVSELNLTLSSPLYLEGQRVGGQVVEAAYWLPILGPFVGGRIEELCQLRISDVQRVNGSWCVRLCDLDENQELKNDNSFRRVPLHDSVIRCGFLLHVTEMARAGHTRVFPSLNNHNSNGTFSNAPGKWFARYLDSLGLSDPRLDYHSYRYSFRQQCSLSGIETEQRDALTGHWSSKGDGASAYLKRENAQYPYPKLATAISMLAYDGLRIEHLFVADPLAGVAEALLR